MTGTPFPIAENLRRVRKVVSKIPEAAVGRVADATEKARGRGGDGAKGRRADARARGTSRKKIPDNERAYRVLVSCILSLRTKDKTTDKASMQLLGQAADLKALAKLPVARIRKLIYPVGFYKTKAKNLPRMAQILLDEWKGQIPKEIEELLTLPGVGRKTANLVRTLGWGLPGICVDIHVHRISNRWGYVKTKEPDKTEMVLRDILPKRYWLTYNDLLVPFGQNVCNPVSPKCSICPLDKLCPKIGVGKRR